MDCIVRWTGDGMSFTAESGSGHLVAMDGSPDGGGRNLAPRPMEMVLIGTGGCTAYDVVLILKRGRHDVRACDVAVQAERAATDPRYSRRSPALHRSRTQTRPCRGRARGESVARKVLFGDRDARQDSDYPTRGVSKTSEVCPDRRFRGRDNEAVSRAMAAVGMRESPLSGIRARRTSEGSDNCVRGTQSEETLAVHQGARRGQT